MVKSFKVLRMQFGTNADKQQAKPVYKHSTYLQSKDSSWINRNTNTNKFDEDREPLEEDIRD